MEAARLAVSVVSPIFKMVGDKAASYFGGDITEEELQHLQNIILPKIQTVLKVAEAAPVDTLKPWLRTLQAAAYEAEDVLDMYEYKRLQAQVSSLPNTLKILMQKAEDFFSPLSLKSELKKSMEKIRKSADEAEKLNFLYGTIGHTPLMQQQQQQQLPTTVSSPSSPVFGRDEERESLVNMLISTTNKLSISERRISILAICGIGGAGKTTLAQSIYNDSRVKEHFAMRMWIHVSCRFDAHEITTKIFRSVPKEGESSEDITHLSLDIVLQTKVEEILKSKKFLVVFYDVWCEDCWECDQMLIPLNKVGGTESMILVTTRREEVASRLGIENVVPLKDLKVEECMSIFKHYSLGDANKVINDPQIAKIAEHIMIKLEKSPLSARIVGSSLKGKKNIADWKHISSKGNMLKDTVATLYLSFENLAPHLQRCFAVCSLYPKGYYFFQLEVNRLVRLSIAQGFVEVLDDDNMTIEDKGMQYFNELLSHSFFQKETVSYGRDYYVIHDLLHDLAEGVSKDHCFRIENDTLRIPTTIMHLSISRKKDLSSNINSEIYKLLNLRTFIIDKISKADFNSIFDARSKIFDTFKKLRVLHLGGHKLSELHKSVGQLKHLRYFQSIGVDRLPESFDRLYHLQYFLKLENTWSINKKVPEVPENLNNLINLRFLEVGDEIISKIPFIGRLTSLQNLACFGASRKAGHGVGQLKYLRELRGSLHIYNLENVQDKAEASEASLNEKKLLENLSLEWTCSSVRDGRTDEEVIDVLEPSPNLNEFRIYGYNGIGLPRWLLNDVGVSNSQFSRLSTLSIVSCPKLKQVPSLPSTLKTVEIERCENLCEASSLPPDLRAVTVRDCPKLKQVPSLPSTLKTVVIERCENLCEASSLPPCLRVVRVKQCPKLTLLCPFPSNIEELEIEECPGVETLLWDVLLFESRDEQQQQQQEKQQLQLKALCICNCSVSGGKKRHLGSWNQLFSSLSRLNLVNIPWLASLLLPDLTSLKTVNIEGCENLEFLGSSLASASSLKWLKVFGCPKLIVEGVEPLVLPPSLEHLTIDDLSLFTAPLRRSRCLNSLSGLAINGCREVAITPEQVEELFPHLTDLYIMHCPNLTFIASLEKLSSLGYLEINDCPKIESLLNLPASLEELRIKKCPEIESLPNLPASLYSLNISSCPKIESLPNLPASLEDLEIKECPKIESLPNLPASLNSLYIQRCPKIESLPNLPASLRRLKIEGCPKIESLPNLPTASLEYLIIEGCHPQLKESYGEGGPLRHKVRHIPELDIL